MKPDPGYTVKVADRCVLVCVADHLQDFGRRQVIVSDGVRHRISNRYSPAHWQTRMSSQDLPAWH